MILIHTSLYASIVVVLSFMTNGIRATLAPSKGCISGYFKLGLRPYCILHAQLPHRFRKLDRKLCRVSLQQRAPMVSASGCHWCSLPLLLMLLAPAHQCRPRWRLGPQISCLSILKNNGQHIRPRFSRLSALKLEAFKAHGERGRRWLLARLQRLW